MAKTSHQTLKNDHHAKKRMQISVSVLGSTSLIRMSANDDDSATQVIRNALKQYDREGWKPVMGSSDPDQYFLYCHDGAGSLVVMGVSDAIGSTGGRCFLMATKKTLSMTSGAAHATKSRTRLAACLNKITRWVK